MIDTATVEANWHITYDDVLHQVPVYLGEFGVYYTAWEDGWFGLYTLPMDHPDSERNEELAEIFEEMLKE